MARLRVNRNSFVGGVFSKKAQANSTAEVYNLGLDTCMNMVIDPLGGAYKRQGSRYVTTLTDDQVRLIEFLYQPGISCMCIFHDGGITFARYNGVGKAYSLFTKTYSGAGISVDLEYVDYSTMSYFQMENKLYFYVGKRENGPISGFWSVEFVSGTDFSFDITPGYKFSPGPKAPYTPSRILRTTYNSDTKLYSFYLVTDDEVVDTTVFTDDDIGRRISFKFYNLGEENSGTYWVETQILTVSEAGEVTSASVTASSQTVNVQPTNDTGKTYASIREWFISSFDGNTDEGGRLGNPEALSFFQGRLYLGKDTYVFASYRSGYPFNFAMGANEQDAFVERITSGNMGNILWMYAIDKLIIGTADGIYLVGNTAQYAESITLNNFVATKIGSMGANSLHPVDAEGNLLFVGTDNKSVYELSIAQDGTYSISKINRLSEDLTRNTIIDHAWQQYPRKIYWAVTNDGALVGCTYDKDAEIRAWHEHTLGGKNTYVLQCETTRESDVDVLWMVVRREVDGVNKTFLETLTPPFDPVQSESFDQEYTDCGTLIQNKQDIINIGNAESYYVSINLDGYVLDFSKVIDMSGGNLVIAFYEDRVLANIITFDDLNYSTLTNTGFFITAYNGSYLISRQNTEINSKMAEARYFFPIVRTITNIELNAGFQTTSSVTVSIDTSFWRKYKDSLLVYIKDSGFDELDGLVFRVANVGAKSFILASYGSGEIINMTLTGEFNPNARLYISVNEDVTDISGQDGYIQFASNVFGETVEDAVIHTARLTNIKGATTYNGVDFNLQLININQEGSVYTYTLVWSTDKDTQGLIFVSNTVGFGVYDTLSTTNGYAYFYFSAIESLYTEAGKEGLLDHLIGQEVVFTTDGNWIEKYSFTLTESMFVDNKSASCKNYELPQPAMSVDFGLPYTCELMPVPLSGGSLFGDSEGCVGTQKQIVLLIYASLGGEYGPDNETETSMRDIPYDWEDDVDTVRPLVTASVKVAIDNNKDNTVRTVYLRNTEPLSFNILSIVQDVNVSDG